jgi:hypothetical protein
MTDDTAGLDVRHPAEVVTAMVDHMLDLAETWPNWDGIPIKIAVDGEEPRLYSPRRPVHGVVDHLLDHQAEIESRVLGHGTEPDEWHGSAMTSQADLSLVTRQDLDEARSRLRRLALIWDCRLRSLTETQFDSADGGSRTLRQIAFHLADSVFYADSVRRLPQ